MITEKSLPASVAGWTPQLWEPFFIKQLVSRSTCVFIDHGLLRKNESDQVMGTLKDGLGLNIHKYDYAETFLSKLKGITDPEKKRKIIGEQFIRAFESVAKDKENAQFLAQGTLYPDVIESGGSALGTSGNHKIAS